MTNSLQQLYQDIHVIMLEGGYNSKLNLVYMLALYFCDIIFALCYHLCLSLADTFLPSGSVARFQYDDPSGPFLSLSVVLCKTADPRNWQNMYITFSAIKIKKNLK
jgi:hypothetical protein